MVSAAKAKRLHVFFSGRVQGVGFRFAACRAAETFTVTGFVRNLWNGEVELVAEGMEGELIGLLNEILGGYLSRYITGHRVNWEEATGAFDRFGVTV